MRYLRVLTNSAIAGALLAGYLLIATLHLNPAFPLALSAVGPLAVALGLAYGANALLVFYALIVLRQIAAVQVLSPGWLSVRVLAWTSTIAAAAGAAVLLLNASDFAPFVAPETGRRMTLAAIAVAICAAVCLVVALAHIGRRGTAPSGVLLVTTMASSLVVPLLLRGPARPPVEVASAAPVMSGEVPGGRVVLVAVDGASLDHISLAVAAGRLPNFGRVLDSAVATHLATVRPTQAEPVWTTVATGRLPQTSGVRSAARYRARADGPALDVLPDYMFAQALVRYGFLREESHAPDALAAKPIWEILSERGLRVGLVGWPLTHPAPSLNGYVVSDVLHRVDDARLALESADAVAPISMWAPIVAARSLRLDPDPHDVLAKVDALPHAGDVDVRADPAPVQADSLHLRIFEVLETTARTSRFAAVRLPGLDAVAHYYLRYAEPTAFGDVSDDERRRFGMVLDDYYGVLDALVGRLHTSLRPDDLVLVVSSHGMEPLTPAKRVLERLVGDAAVSGTHERAPDGFVMAFGGAVRAARPDRGSVADIAPTILYFLGLPIGRDMDGTARTDFFSPSFTSTRPVAFIPSYGR